MIKKENSIGVQTLKAQIVLISIVIVLSLSSSIVEAISPGWTEPIFIKSGMTPTLLQDTNGTFWLAWVSGIEGPYGDIWISNSTDGVTWSVPVMITDNNTRDDMPSLIQDSNGTYWLAFKNATAGGDQNIWIQNSSDGTNWNTPIPIVTDSYKDYWPSLMQDSNGTFWVIWESQDRNPTNNDIYYSTSDDGVNWSAPVNIPTNATYFDYGPDIIEDSNGTYWVAWRCGYGSVDNICITNSTNGSSWSPPQEIIITGEKPALMQNSTGLYWLAMNRLIGGNRDIYFSTSTNGTNWSAPRRITTNTSDDRIPSVIRDSNGTIWIVWTSDRRNPDLYWDIWLTHSTVTLTSPLAGETWNGVQNITWVSVSDDYQNDTFNLYYSTNGTNWTLIQSDISADDFYTNKSYEWDTSSVADGTNYTVKILRVHPLHNESNVSGVFTIDNGPPNVTNIVPASGSYVGGMRYINATVVDVISGVSSVVANVSNSTWFGVYALSESGSGNVWYNDSWDTGKLIDGDYSIRINATDIAGNSNDTEYVTVTVDNTRPTVSIQYPQNDTYQSEVWFNATVDEPADWCGYSLDGQANVTMANSSGNWNGINSSMAEGSHSVTFHCNDTAGNMNGSATVYFTVDTTPPTVTYASPTPPDNYNSSSAAVTFNATVTDAATAVSACLLELDGVNYTMEVVGTGTSVQCNLTNSSMAEGSHSYTIHANDSTNKWDSETARTLTIDTVRPTITITSPANTAYASSSVALSYSVSEPTSWEAYSLDGAANQTGGNQTLSGLSNGNHNITVWANDTAGNMNYSTAYFSVDVKGANTPSDGGYVWRPRIVLLANSIDLNLSTEFMAYMTSKGAKVEYLNASNFSKYKKMRNIVILGGPDAPEGVGEIVQDVLNETEQGEVRAKGSERFYMKEDIWTGYQRVFILAGSDRWRTQEASIDNMATVKNKLR